MGVLVSPCLVFSWLWSFPVSRTWLCLHSHGTHEDPSHATASLCQGHVWGN